MQGTTISITNSRDSEKAIPPDLPPDLPPPTRIKYFFLAEQALIRRSQEQPINNCREGIYGIVAIINKYVTNQEGKASIAFRGRTLIEMCAVAEAYERGSSGSRNRTCDALTRLASRLSKLDELSSEEAKGLAKVLRHRSDAIY